MTGAVFLSEKMTNETSGRLGQGVLLPLLRRLHVERRTGLLHTRRGDDRASVCLIRGAIAWGHTNLYECRMGECLVRHGRLSTWDLDRASEIVVLTNQRLGRVLVEMGLLDEAGLDAALALHVREILLTVFAWSDGEWSFEASDPEQFKGVDRPLSLATAEVILDAVWSLPNPDVVRFALGDLDRPLVHTRDDRLRMQNVALTPEDGFLLSRVDGHLTARQVLGIAQMSSSEGERRLLGLLSTGMVEYAEPRPAPAPVPTPAPPIPPRVPAAEAAKPPLELVPPPPPPPSPPEIDNVLRTADAAYSEDRPWEAMAAVEGILPFVTGRQRTRALLLRARVYLKEPGREKDAERELRNLVEGDAQSAEAFYLLGTLARDSNRPRQAMAYFRKALEINPKHSGARAEVPGDEAPPAGLLGKLFSR